MSSARRRTGMAMVAMLLVLATLLHVRAAVQASQGAAVRQVLEVGHASVFSLLPPTQAARAPMPPVVHEWEPRTLPLARMVPRAERVSPAWAASEIVALRVTLPQAIDRGEVALYVPRFDGVAETTVFLDGRNLLSAVDMPAARHFNRPFLVVLSPRDPGRVGDREIIVTRVGRPHFQHRVSSIWLAPRSEAVQWQLARLWVQAEGPRLVSGGLLLLGLFAFFVWLRRRRDTAFLWFFVLTLLFFARCWHYHSVFPAGVPAAWTVWITTQSLNGISVCVLLFARAFHGVRDRQRRMEQALLVAALVLAALNTPPLAASVLVPMGFTGAHVYIAGALLCLGAALLLARAAWLARSGLVGLLAGVLLLNLALGLHDLAMLAGAVSLDRVYLLPFGGLAMFVTFLWAIARQHGQALHQADEARRGLQARLAEREAELRASLETLQHEREQRVLADERQRLMREMHDGLGSALASSLVAVQRGQATPELLRGMLGDAVDELRLTIDSLEPSGGDLLLLLATARWRLEPRLQAAGVALHWQVGELPPLPWLTAQHALHLLRILQELLANVVRHAQAQHVTIATAALGDVIEVGIRDDGRGFDLANAPAGRGRANVARRAAALGATLHWDSAPGRGTCVTLRLPVRAPVPLPAGAGLPAPESKPS